MPIAVKCGCGKQLKVRDELAGKAIKCPDCASVVKVPAGGGAAAKPRPAKPRPTAPRAAAPARPAPMPESSELDDLFAEEGMDREMGAVCPACRKELPPGAVLCTNCGFNKETGERFEKHQVAGVDIDKGTMALDKAERDMDEAKRLQKEMIGKSGMPAWMLALVLFILASAMGIAVLAVNASRREEAINFNPMQMFMNLGGSAFLLVALGALLSLITVAFRSDTKQGLLSLTILYLFVFPFKYGKGTWKILAVALICGGISAAFFYGASRM
ncbi:zinc ribbon domain-containing protein [Allorhodopirellula solitaria]|uniref:Double zinc ribbon n=1 Tax=Allorhodopirellula solitaria TaxID=2527987 RepID=A0A5C5YJZ1_9BACT|nr:zinc ribbon domain-containing protein [Allorhodopirellula solitaria]TWT75147.1 hypothetical protein CA85_04360 [Allorhodopirellula solitaria]